MQSSIACLWAEYRNLGVRQTRVEDLGGKIDAIYMPYSLSRVSLREGACRLLEVIDEKHSSHSSH